MVAVLLGPTRARRGIVLLIADASVVMALARTGRRAPKADYLLGASLPTHTRATA